MNINYMKTFRFNLLFILTMIMSSLLELRAQNSYEVDIDGIMLNSSMTKEEVIAKFGEPDSYYINDDGSLVGLVETYVYGDNTLSFMNNELNGFYICDERWPVMNDIFVGGLKVGDNICVFDKKEQLQLLKHNRLPDTYWILDNPIHESTPDFNVMITLSDNRITSISYTETY